MNLSKRLKKKKKARIFPVGYVRTKSDKELHKKRKYNDKTSQYTPSPPNRKVGYTWLQGKNCTKNKVKAHTNTVYVYVKNIFPNETPKRPRQCYKCTECNSAFDARHKLKKHTREQHEGKFENFQNENHLELNPKLTYKLSIQTKKSSKNKLLQREKKFM